MLKYIVHDCQKYMSVKENFKTVWENLEESVDDKSKSCSNHQFIVYAFTFKVFHLLMMFSNSKLNDL